MYEHEMYIAICLKDIDRARQLLDLGADPSSCSHEKGEALDTLRLCVRHSPSASADMVKLLLEKRARLTSERERDLFLEDVWFMVESNARDDGSSFKEYMPLLRVLSENALITAEMIKKVVEYAPRLERGAVEEELLSLLLKWISKGKSCAEMGKNSYLLCQAERTAVRNPGECAVGNLPEALQIAIAALTANNGAYTYDEALGIAGMAWVAARDSHSAAAAVPAPLEAREATNSRSNTSKCVIS